VILGAHVRRRQAKNAGGIAGAIEEAAARGSDCLQIFISNPRSWAGPRYDDAEIERFREALAASGLRPCVAHLSYVGNVASWDPTTLGRTRELLVETVHACDALGVDLLVVHTGAGGPQDRDAALRAAADTFGMAVDEALRVRVLAELMAGTTGAVASLPHEAQELCEEVGDDRLGLCLDTAHLFAAGLPLDDPAGVAGLSGELQGRGLARRLALVHANDSVFERGARRDRHTNIGDGLIGADGWRALATDPLLASVPWMLETPGDAARQRADIAYLRRLGTSGKREVRRGDEGRSAGAS
jgi:deoxyribonuclease-4